MSNSSTQVLFSKTVVSGRITSAGHGSNTFVGGSGIDWQYFFGGSSNNGRCYDRYYKAEINGREVEKHISNRGTVYAVGNIDKAKIKYKNESELLKALSA